jgi:PhoPQ-activated pathogenicity-related protein
MVAGQSKRGWTTWLMGGIDDRIVALAPVVLSCLNMVENFHHYWRSLGGWSFALYDYWMHGLMGLIDEPETFLMQQIIDPYFYRAWLTMPKLMVSGASDEFFMADDYDYFFKDLLGEKYIWLLENSGHSVDSGPLEEDYWLMLQTFYISVLTNYERPHMEWVKNETDTGGQIVLLSPTTPLSITSFYSQSIVPDRRDWRSTAMNSDGDFVDTNVIWLEKPVEDLGNNYYRVQHDNPPEGYLAFFIKVGYPGPDGRVLYFTTEANIIPYTWPYADCSGSECQGTLV